jgi:hypothetical protein
LKDNHERRKDRRIAVKWPITVFTGTHPIDGETRNISLDGMFISSKEPLRLNEFYKISLKIPKQPDIELSGQVVWSDLYGIDRQKEAYGMGFCFLQVSEKDRHLLKAMLSSIQP